METVLKAAVFVNEEDGQVRAAHKILGYDPIQKSFAALKHVIRANDPRLQKITVVEHGFLISEGSPVPEGIPLAGSSPSTKQQRTRVIWVCPKRGSVYLTKLIHPRILLVT